MKNIAINGFGRIGRLVFRGFLNNKEYRIIAINDLMDTKSLAYLLKHDSVHGILKNKIEAKEGAIVVDGVEIKVFSERDPEDLPWKELDVSVVVESTGIFRTQEGASKHLTAGAQKVIISAPAKGDVDATIVLGVNDETLKPEHKIISNASCTTNCLAPVMKVITNNFTVESALMTTIHSYTMDQRLLDYPHSDLRRARAAALNIIPTTTGAATATAKVIPELKGKIDGMAVRVPTPTGSLVDVSIIVDRKTNKEEINKLMKEASENRMNGILEYVEGPIVSTDIIAIRQMNNYSITIKFFHGNFIKVLSWYDNEAGYANRVIDLVQYISELE